MNHLLSRLAPTSENGLPLLISAVTGMGGIGKTALAAEAAHRARAEGWFPGGFLFVDLRGYDDNPVTADQGVLALLDAMGVQGANLPLTTARQYDVYRDLLDKRQERMLVILDNASAASQYLPLLPGTEHHRVLITSRDLPGGVPVHVVGLGTLDPEESVALITDALHSTDPADGRPAREPEALRELTALCGHLPLALQIAAAMLRRRHRDIASLVAEIRSTGSTIGALDRPQLGPDWYGRSLTLRPVLATSYARLSADQARLLRLLARGPGAETSTETAAVLAELASHHVLEVLEGLAAAHLVMPVRGAGPTESGMRWRLHDLVREFGLDVVREDVKLFEEGSAARERVLAYYGKGARAADRWLRWLPGKQIPGLFRGQEAALAWLDQERVGLLAAVGWTREERFERKGADLALWLAEYLDRRRAFDDKITAMSLALDAGRRVGDMDVQVAALTGLGIALREVDRGQEAVEVLTRACSLCGKAGDRRREGMVWGNLGSALLSTNQVQEAVEALTRSRTLFEEAGDVQGAGMAWNNIGAFFANADRVQEAIEAFTCARDLFREAGDRRQEGIAWGNLGVCLREAGLVQKAVEAYGEALAMCQESGDWYGAGQTLGNLGRAHTALQAEAAARSAFLQAAEAFTRAKAPAEAAQARTQASELQD
ncbi:tetratricopeptide repeat protein [Streptomyces sp. NPDC090088]|uniref:tetratricopeptide repeat protein n=1 Tax=Streptomyces sp. NPDC090088 TaxID=3365944 RepID=UPI00381EB65F